jgi:hypothetical protein
MSAEDISAAIAAISLMLISGLNVIAMASIAREVMYTSYQYTSVYIILHAW